MSDYAAAAPEGKPTAGAISAQLRSQLQEFLGPVLGVLDQQLDARLVRTFAAVVDVIRCFRHRN